MARIFIDYTGVSSANQILRQAVHELAQMEDAYASLANHVDPEIQSRYQIAGRLRICRQSAEEIYRVTDEILDVAESGLLAYRITEAKLKREVPADDKMFEMR